MPKFSRGFRFLNRLFPPAGSEFPNPKHVSDTIQLIADPLRLGFVHPLVRLESFGSAVDTLNVSTNIDLPDVPAGFIRMPHGWAAICDDTVNRTVAVIMINTAAALDPWGNFPDPTVGFPFLGAYSTMRIGGNMTSCILPTLAHARGNSLRARLISPSAAPAVVNFGVVYYGLLIPGEIVSLEQWAKTWGNFTWNQPM